jgi:starch-binding outer membrane protein, SusD/RagB family
MKNKIMTEIKKIKQVITKLLLIIAIIGSSCSDWLEIYPTSGLITEQYWHTKEDIEAVLMGAYKTLADMSADLVLHGELRADMVQDLNSTPNNLEEIKAGIIEPSNDFTKWDEFYKAINYCNLVLENSEAVLEDDPTFSEVQLTYYQSEAKFVRALSYFYLVRIFDRVPFVLEPTLADDSELYFPNVSGDSILTEIASELVQIGINFLPIDYGSPQRNKGRATFNAVQALLADIALWQFRYDDCLQHIQNIEDNSIDGLHLMASEAWTEIYYPGNSQESIFEFQFSDAFAESNSLFDLTFGTSVDIEASSFAIEIFTEDLVSNRQIFTIDENTITKYVLTNTGSIRSDIDRNAANFIVYRAADLILMKAEALAMQDRFEEAEVLINQVFRRSNPLLSDLEIESKRTSFEDAILQERAKEFAYEGKRWFDLLRMGRRDNFLRKDLFIEYVISQFPEQDKFVKRSRLRDSNGWYLPIHEDELDNNLLLIQNPFYASYTE